MKFGTAFERARKGAGMRLPKWPIDKVVKAHIPSEEEENKESYLYVNNGKNVFRWSATNEELFSEDWETIE